MFSWMYIALSPHIRVIHTTLSLLQYLHFIHMTSEQQLKRKKKKKRASSDDKIVLQPKFNKSNELFFRKQTNICDYGRNTSELRKSYSDIVFIVFLFFFSFYFLLQQTNGTKIMSIIIEFYINYFYIWSNLLHLLDDNVKELTTLILRFVSTSSLASLLYLMRFGCVTTTP